MLKKNALSKYLTKFINNDISSKICVSLKVTEYNIKPYVSIQNLADKI